jgi:malonyl-CoA decarboxylase
VDGPAEPAALLMIRAFLRKHAPGVFFPAAAAPPKAAGTFLAEAIATRFAREMDGAQKADFLATIASEIPNQERLFARVLSDVPGGLEFLVSLRADLMQTVRQRGRGAGGVHDIGAGGGGGGGDGGGDDGKLAQLRALDANLQKAMTEWFSEAALDLNTITMDSPSCVLDKVVGGEKVHPISSREALAQRLGQGRRCFALFHPSFPSEPLCVVHVALLPEIASSMDVITGALAQQARVEEARARAAVFYSISSTQPGLAGVNLGNMLIKRAARHLLEEFADGDLCEFSTLSPMPTFRGWLKDTATAAQDEANGNGLVSLLPSSGLLADHPSAADRIFGLLEDTESDVIDVDLLQEKVRAAEGTLMHLAAHFISREKKSGQTVDRVLCPVGNFHISNGAAAWRLNLLGDTSPRGMQNSLGTMINYRYDLDEIEGRSERYAKEGTVAQGEAFKAVLGGTV